MFIMEPLPILRVLILSLFFSIYLVGCIPEHPTKYIPHPVDNSCQSEKLVFYKVVLHTFWTEDLFPKNIPALPQWSKLIGGTSPSDAMYRRIRNWLIYLGHSHGKNYSIFHIGYQASKAMKEFAETGNERELNQVGQSNDGIFDMFVGPSIRTGAGRTESQFMVDGNHSMVSLVVKLIPSPDWFTGLDSFSLCINGNWLDSVTVEVDPIDAGTQNGFSFNSEKWPTKPTGLVYVITNKFPQSQYASFYYPDSSRLTPIATFQFIKLRAYNLNEDFSHTRDEKNYDVFKYIKRDLVSTTPVNWLDFEMENSRLQYESATQKPDNNRVQNEIIASRIVEMAAPSNYDGGFSYVSKLKNESLHHSLQNNMRMNKKKKYHSKNCHTSQWGKWSKCSVSCGIGEMQRERTVIMHQKGKGFPCPPLLETKLCSVNQCKKNGSLD